MKVEKRTFQGRVKTWLFMMDRELRNGQNSEIYSGYLELKRKIEDENGVELVALPSGESLVIEACGMMYWVNCRKNQDGMINVFVSSRRKVI